MDTAAEYRGVGSRTRQPEVMECTSEAEEIDREVQLVFLFGGVLILSCPATCSMCVLQTLETSRVPDAASMLPALSKCGLTSGSLIVKDLEFPNRGMP